MFHRATPETRSIATRRPSGLIVGAEADAAAPKVLNQSPVRVFQTSTGAIEPIDAEMIKSPSGLTAMTRSRTGLKRCLRGKARIPEYGYRQCGLGDGAIGGPYRPGRGPCRARLDPRPIGPRPARPGGEVCRLAAASALSPWAGQRRCARRRHCRRGRLRGSGRCCGQIDAQAQRSDQCDQTDGWPRRDPTPFKV
jgi:hypothetical protein